jgi:cell division protein FtsN
MNLKSALLYTLMVFFIFTHLSTHAQDQNKLDQRPWSFNLNFGQTLFWGDGNNDIVNPFGAYFQNDKSAFGYGLIVQKNFNSWLGMDIQYLGGQLKGTRYTWSNDVAADLYFLTNMHHFGLNLDIDVFDIFLQPKTTRLFNFYVRGGGAYNLYNATEYSLITDQELATAKSGALQVNGGWGVRFDVSKKVGITFENIFSYAFDDFLDAHSSQYSQANDLFAYTSLGLTYRIFPQPKKPQLDDGPDSQGPDIIANNDDNPNKDDSSGEEEVKPELSLSVDLPSEITQSDTVMVRIKINKHDLNEAAKLQQTLPMGFAALENNTAGSKFNFADQIVSFTWESFPQDDEVLSVTYFLVSNNVNPGNYKLPGILFFNEKGFETIKQFKESLDVVKPSPVVAQNNTNTSASGNQNPDNSHSQNAGNNSDNVQASTQPSNNNNTQAQQQEPVSQPVSSPANTQTNTQTPVEGLEYRVQVRAIYGGKSTPSAVARQYGISEEVSEEFSNGYSKYTAGHFSTYAEAEAYKRQLRAGKVPGAFVVAYNNGARMSNIQDAIKMQGSTPASVVHQSTKVSEPGLSYSVQIAASARELSATSLKNQFGLSYDVVKTTHNGLYKYVIGSYTSYSEAKAALDQIRNSVPDAFLVKYRDGVRD